MKLVTLQQVEEFLRENPKKKLIVSENAYFSNTGAFNSLDEEVENPGSDIKFMYDGVELRRFEQGYEGDFQATAFLHTADEALKVVRAFVALEHVFSTPYVEAAK